MSTTTEEVDGKCNTSIAVPSSPPSSPIPSTLRFQSDMGVVQEGVENDQKVLPCDAAKNNTATTTVKCSSPKPQSVIVQSSASSSPQHSPRLSPRKSCLRRRYGSMPDLASVGTTSSSITTESVHGGPLLPEDDLEASQHSGSISSKSSVRFGTIEFREHPLVLGDHPDCSYGPPVQLDWECNNVSSHDVDEYELGRGPRRRKANLSLTYYQRKNILMNEAGMTKDEIKNATKKVEREKMRRSITKAMLPLAPVETILESSGRKVKRVVDSKKQERIEKQAFKKNNSIHGSVTPSFRSSGVGGSNYDQQLQAYGHTYKKASSSLPILRSWRGKS